MLYLNKDDINRLVSLEELVSCITKAFIIYGSKNFEMPDRIHLHRNDDTVLYMPCFTESIFGTKIITVFPQNTQNNIPAIQGIMLVNDIKTGKPLAVIDGACLTAYRTGAVGGVGIDLTAKDNCDSVGLVGAGVQGYYQLLFAAHVRKIKRIYIHDLYSQKLSEFKNKLEKQIPNVEITICDSIKELITHSQIIITATNSNEPVLPNNSDLLKGKHIIAIGSYKPNMRELPESLFKLLETVFVDTEFSVKEAGDLITPLNNKWITEQQIKTLDKLLVQGSELKHEKETTLFKSVGMALFDLVVAEYIYNKAIELGIGQKVNL